MEEFREEVHNISTEDLLLIIQDQKDLYSDEEFEILKEELELRPDKRYWMGLDEEDEKRSEWERKKEEIKEAIERQIKENALTPEERRQAKYEENARILSEESKVKIEKMRNDHVEGYWEYKVIKLTDDSNGDIDANDLEFNLNSLGLDGWHLKCAYTNELGRNSSSSGAFGMSSGTNATIDQNVLIFERFVRI